MMRKHSPEEIFGLLAYFGHVPKPDKSCVLRLKTLPTIEVGDVSDTVYVKDVFLRCLQRCLDGVPRGARVLVPISGGYDSRAVLAGMVELDSDFQIETMTCGASGWSDTRIGPQVAAALGVGNQLLSQADDTFRWTNLVKTVETFYTLGIQVAPFNPTSYWSTFDGVNDDVDACVVGYLGEACAGAHLGSKGTIPEAALARFVKWNRRLDNSRLMSSQFNPYETLPTVNELSSSLLAPDDYLDFTCRQFPFIRPVICPPKWKLRSPFEQLEWVALTQAVPREKRLDYSWYNGMLKAMFPKAFSIPLKNPRRKPNLVDRLKKVTHPLRKKVNLVRRKKDVNKWGRNWNKTLLETERSIFVPLVESAFSRGIELGIFNKGEAQSILLAYKDQQKVDATVLELVIGAYLVHCPEAFQHAKNKFDSY